MEPSDKKNGDLPALQLAPSTIGVPSEHELLAYQAYAKTAVESQMYKGVGKEAGLMMIILAAREYGIGPCQALNNGIRIIEGNVELSARMISALIRRAKHNLKVLESSSTKCVVYGKRRDNGDELTVAYTIEMAQRAGLIKEKGSWKKNPEDMLFARAVSRLSRQLFSDVVGIGYIEGEIDDSIEVKEPCMKAFDVPVKEPEAEPSEVEMLENIMQTIDKEEKYQMLEFLDLVKNHYKWDKITTLKEFLKDKNKTLEKFQNWKNKKAA